VITLKSVLKSLCGARGVRGALIITKDGMVIESNLPPPYNADTLAAFMSQIALTITNSLNGLGVNEFTRYVMQSSQSKIYIVDLGRSALIALADMDVDAGEMNVAIFQAANTIKKTGRIEI
jgi:hypothetical protein